VLLSLKVLTGLINEPPVPNSTAPPIGDLNPSKTEQPVTIVRLAPTYVNA
jgi:hypothetical protein